MGQWLNLAACHVHKPLPRFNLQLPPGSPAEFIPFPLNWTSFRWLHWEHDICWSSPILIPGVLPTALGKCTFPSLPTLSSLGKKCFSFTVVWVNFRRDTCSQSSLQVSGFGEGIRRCLGSWIIQTRERLGAIMLSWYSLEGFANHQGGQFLPHTLQ